MRSVSVLLAASFVFAGAAFAAGSHSGSHDTMAIGKPGKKAKVTKTVQVIMKENEDGSMLFVPARLSFKEGQTVRLKFANKGEVHHEFVMDEVHALAEHKKLMEKFPEMEHDDPNAISLAPGKKGEIIWTFAKSGTFAFACLVPGHQEAGMHGLIDIDRAVASKP
jgi:uncharacterized cupredoxin-like copper-binding protein